jgi:hypothetical protein
MAMSSVAVQIPQPAIKGAAETLDAFWLRCWARAYLVKHGMMRLQEAVDGLQEAAVPAGLVDLLGQDPVQLILAKAFDPSEDRKC